MLKINKIYFVFLFVVFCFGFFKAQSNLVLNPSFETYTTCPTTLDQTYLATGWSAYSYSPDYFNACATPSGVSVPSNAAGYQTAASGVAYAGLIAFANGGGSNREIIGSQLTQTLSTGQTYYVSIKVNLAEFIPSFPQYIPCNKVGVKFSTVPCTTLNPAPINNFAHIYTNTIISDTMNWTIIKGAFIADSNYKYIMIGNFFDDANTDTITRPTIQDKAYFFVDDVCISTSSVTCPGFTGIETIKGIENVKFFPNPTNSYLKIDSETNETFFLSIFNTIGEEIYTNKFRNRLEVDISEFSNGIYFINLKSKEKTIKKKIIIYH